MTTTYRTLTLAALTALLVPVIACDGKVDPKAAEGELKKMMAEKNVTLATVTCPPNQSMKAGTTFQCSATDEMGTPATFTMKMLEGGRPQMSLDGKYLDLKKVGDGMEANLKAKTGQDVDVMCPSKNIIIKKGVKFSCDAKMGDKTTKLAFVFTDDEGAAVTDGAGLAAVPAAPADHAPSAAPAAPHASASGHPAHADDHAAEHH